MNGVRSDIITRQSEYPSFYFAGPVFTGVNGWPLCMTCDHTSSREITPDSPVEAMVSGLAGKTDFIKIIYDGLPGNADKFPRAAGELAAECLLGSEEPTLHECWMASGRSGTRPAGASRPQR